MDIRAERNTKVKFVNDQRHGFGVAGNDNHLLTLGSTYTVDRTEVHTWHTKVFLTEFPDAVFNSVCFE